MKSYSVQDANSVVGKEFDDSTYNVLICCASFEQRSLTVPLGLTSEQFNRVFVCEHVEVAEYVKSNAKILRKHFGLKTRRVSLSLSDPLATLDHLAKAIGSIGSKKPRTYIVDITTFTHESQLILLKLLTFFAGPNDKVRFLYATAAKYSIDSVGSEENENEEGHIRRRWLSKGVKEIRSVVGYPGVLLPSRKLHLIVLSGYEELRAARIIDNYEANYVSVGVGDKNESIHPALYELNQNFHRRLCSFYRNVETFSFSLTNPTNARDDIQAQINKHPSCNTIIAPLNTKISTIGAALAALNNREIQLAYAEVNFYNTEDYSKPGRRFFLFDIPSLISKKAKVAVGDW